MKAVIWTDTVQMMIMYGSIMLVIFKGMSEEGGFGAVWQRNLQSGRLEFFE